VVSAGGSSFFANFLSSEIIMNDLLFYALIIALLYYFLVYLPKQKQVSPITKPFTHSQATQTEPTLDCPSAQLEPNAELEHALNALLNHLQELNQEI
jgi:hypothetical protein